MIPDPHRARSLARDREPAGPQGAHVDSARLPPFAPPSAPASGLGLRRGSLVSFSVCTSLALFFLRSTVSCSAAPFFLLGAPENYFYTRF